MNREKYKIIKIRPPRKNIAPFAVALIGGTCYSALCWDEGIAKKIRSALNTVEGGINKPPTTQETKSAPEISEEKITVHPKRTMQQINGKITPDCEYSVKCSKFSNCHSAVRGLDFPIIKEHCFRA